MLRESLRWRLADAARRARRARTAQNTLSHAFGVVTRGFMITRGGDMVWNLGDASRRDMVSCAGRKQDARHA